MVSARHDVYIFEQISHGETRRLVRPSTIAVSASTPAIRFRNMIDANVTIVIPPETPGLRAGDLELRPNGSGILHINWFDEPSGVVSYTVSVESRAVSRGVASEHLPAEGNSDPSIIFD